MLLTCSGDLNESFEYLFIILAQLEQEIWSKCHARSNFIEKSEKKHKSLGRDLKKIFLPNKKYFSLVSDGIRNFLSGGWENLFLTYPPYRKLPFQRLVCEIAQDFETDLSLIWARSLREYARQMI